MGSYLAHSYVSWEKGGVEDMNELIIRYIPKNIGILTVMIEQIQTKLNNKHSKKRMDLLIRKKLFRRLYLDNSIFTNLDDNILM